LRRTNHAQAQLVRRLNDTDQPPPRRRLRRFERLLSGHEPRAIHDLGINTPLLRPSRQRVGGTLDLEGGQLAVDRGHIHAHIALTQPELVEKNGVILKLIVREVSLQQVAHFAITGWFGREPGGYRNGRGGHPL
jgi:hypothetical protein